MSLDFVFNIPFVRQWVWKYIDERVEERAYSKIESLKKRLKVAEKTLKDVRGFLNDHVKMNIKDVYICENVVSKYFEFKNRGYKDEEL